MLLDPTGPGSAARTVPVVDQPPVRRQAGEIGFHRRQPGWLPTVSSIVAHLGLEAAGHCSEDDTAVGCPPPAWNAPKGSTTVSSSTASGPVENSTLVVGTGFTGRRASAGR